MQNYRMTIAFNGSRYAGWQRQKDAPSVQQTVEEILRSVFHEDIPVTGCGRTDAGVHAQEMTLSFRTSGTVSAGQLSTQLNRRLPHDMRLLDLSPAAADFNAHRSACGKAYVYAVHTGAYNVYLKDLCWDWPEIRFPSEVKKSLPLLAGTHDFRSFTGRKADACTVRTIHRAELIPFGPLWCFYFSGSGFLYKMVRRLTGLLHEIATGKKSADDLKNMLEHPAVPPDAITVAPPQGLYLRKTFYAPDEWKSDELRLPPFL